MFTGIITALITPFREEKIDEQAFAEFVNWQINQGVNGLVVCGTTGEGMLLSHAEQKRLIELCVEVTAKRVPVIAGTSAVSTPETLTLTQQAQSCGADGALILSPWYVKPSQGSLIEHFRTLHDNTDLPILVYNNPSRTGVNIEIDTIATLSQYKRIVGIKDACDNLCRIQHLRALTGPDFSFLAGDDTTYPAYLALGGNGVISSTANAAPRLFVEIQRAWESGNLESFQELRDKLHPFVHSMGVASNPQPVKFAASLLGNITQETRLPFEPLNSDDCEAIRNSLKSVGAWNEQPSFTMAPA